MERDGSVEPGCIFDTGDEEFGETRRRRVPAKPKLPGRRGRGKQWPGPDEVSTTLAEVRHNLCGPPRLK